MLELILISALFTTMTLANSDQEKFAKEALMAHNLYRRIHGVEPLKLNANLSNLALKRAEELAMVGQLNVKQNFYDGINLGETVGLMSGFSDYNGILPFKYPIKQQYFKLLKCVLILYIMLIIERNISHSILVQRCGQVR